MGEVVDIVRAGDELPVVIGLTDPVAIEIGTPFSICEDGRTIASGRVLCVYGSEVESDEESLEYFKSFTLV